MTPKAPPQTLETANAERDRLAVAARVAGDLADALAAERWEVLNARRQDWARTVLADHAAVAAGLAKAETAAARSFRAAAVDAADPRAAFLEWLDTRSRSNAQRDRLVAARAFLGEPQTEDAGYPHRDVPSFSAAVDSALAAEASARFADAQGEVQREINALDVLP